MAPFGKPPIKALLSIKFDLDVEKIDDTWVGRSHLLGFVFEGTSEENLYDVIDKGLDFFFNSYAQHRGLDAIRRWLDTRGVEHSLPKVGLPRYSRTRTAELQIV